MEHTLASGYAAAVGGKLRMMVRNPSVTGMTPAGAKRSVSAPMNHNVPDASSWSAQMAAVSVQRDRASFMRIHDHFAPRLQRYLRNLGVAESIADELVHAAAAVRILSAMPLRSVSR